MSSNTQATLKLSGGGPAPTFVVPNLHGGTPLSLAAYRGRPVIVSFWASWCNYCRQEMPALEQFSKSHRRVAVLGIATLDEDGASRAFATTVGATYPLGKDADGTLLARYGGIALPVTAFIGSRGQLISTVNGQVTASDLAAIAPRLGA